MDFRTRTELPKNHLKLTFSQKMLTVGSCFSDHIGQKLLDAGFNCRINPCGVLYNPSSIASVLNGTFSDNTALWLQQGIDPHAARQAMKEQADIVMVTFGTAWVFRLKSDGTIVANCRKQPEDLFQRNRLTVQDIVEEWIPLLNQRLKDWPQTQFIFTVSPIRHKNDGLHGNQLSKATLLLAVEQLCNAFPESCQYFPAYEIVMDELRDYRFYADDMMHPSSLAIDYIWQCFCQTFLNNSTQQMATHFERLHRTLRHQPSNPDDPTYRKLIENTRNELNKLICSTR